MNCEMIKLPQAVAQPGGGGNRHAAGLLPRNIVVRRNAAIGDSLCATVVADKLIDQGFSVTWQTHPDIHCVIRRHPRIGAVERPVTNPDVNLDGAYEKHPQRTRLHFHQMFVDRANADLARLGIHLGPALNCTPTIRLSPVDKAIAQAKCGAYPRPWVFVCPRSDTYACRQVPDGIWQAASEKMEGTKFWIGRHPAPPGFIDLEVRHMDNLIVWLSAADLLVTVDTGPMHIAAALGIPILALGQSSSPELHLSDQCDFLTIEPKGLDCLNCQKNKCPINADIPPCQNFEPEVIAAWTNAKLRQGFGDHISAVVPIYQPEVGTLNRCLECLLPQVSEIIVATENNSRVPAGMLKHDKIRVVKKGLSAIGYGRNVNHGTRYTTGKYLLHMNDDIFLEPDAVAKMKECLTPGVGMVANRLMYPDGTVYHAGKTRAPGARGWGHLEHKQTHWSIKEPTEMENVCGACVLLRREAFYGIRAFDEDFFIYAEDDDFALRMRRGGWKIIYTPHSVGTHLEHQSTQKLGDIMGAVAKANRIFNSKWGRYLDHNLNRIPGDFNY
jgi:GT2 family glycosyltransferase